MKDFYGLIILIFAWFGGWGCGETATEVSVGAAPILVITSVLMDEQVTEPAELDFAKSKNYCAERRIDGIAIIGHGADHDKREKGRDSADVVKELKDDTKSSFELYDDNIRVPEGVWILAC